MKWELSWSEDAQRDLAKLDRQAAARVIRSMARFAETGHGDAATLRPPLAGRRLRVGDWRVMFDAEDEHSLLHVTRVYHRREAYRSR